MSNAHQGLIPKGMAAVVEKAGLHLMVEQSYGPYN